MKRKHVVISIVLVVVAIFLIFNTNTYYVPLNNGDNHGYSCFGVDFDTHLPNSNEVKQRICIGMLTDIERI